MANVNAEEYNRIKRRVSQVLVEEFKEEEEFADFSAEQTLKMYMEAPQKQPFLAFYLKSLRFFQNHLRIVVLILVSFITSASLSWYLHEPTPTYPIDVYTSQEIATNGSCFNVTKSGTKYKVCIPKEIIPSVNNAIRNAPQIGYTTVKGNDGKFYLISKENNQIKIRIKND